MVLMKRICWNRFLSSVSPCTSSARSCEVRAAPAGAWKCVHAPLMACAKYFAPALLTSYFFHGARLPLRSPRGVSTCNRVLGSPAGYQSRATRPFVFRAKHRNRNLRGVGIRGYAVLVQIFRRFLYFHIAGERGHNRFLDPLLAHLRHDL